MTKTTKIIATAGPASKDPVVIEELVRNGVDIFRFNFKHNEKNWHAETIKLVKRISENMGVNAGTMLDLPGPRIRLDMGAEELRVDRGDLIPITENRKGEKSMGISHPEIIPLLNKGQKITADDGAFVFHVEEINGRRYARSESSGILKNKKSLNIIGLDFNLPPIDDRDLEGLKLAGEVGVDFIALSSVNNEHDINYLRNEMEKYGVKAGIISKIETKKAITNIDKIIEFSDAVMIARGDLGVEIPIEQVPYYQKIAVKKCIEKGVPVIIATQMLHSMVDNPFPTRAEISDVANAAYELADAVMLSAETAFGNYPVETVSIMRDTIDFNSRKSTDDTRLEYDFAVDGQASMICDAAYNLYLQSQKDDDRIEGFIVYTLTGKTANLLSRYRPTVPIYTFCPKREIADRLNLNYGVMPFLVEEDMKKIKDVTKDEIFRTIEYLLSKKLVRKGSRLIILYGDLWSIGDGTSTIKVVRCV